MIHELLGISARSGIRDAQKEACEWMEDFLRAFSHGMASLRNPKRRRIYEEETHYALVYESGLALMSLGVEQLSHDETALLLCSVFLAL